jgi:hypothetical protein
MSDVPATDEDVLKMIDTEYSGDLIFKESMRGIHRARRGMGNSVDDAYIYMLRCHVDPKHPSLTPLSKKP